MSQYKKSSFPSMQCSESNLMEDGSITSVEELQNQLRDALQKNKQWLEYDQKREAYVKGILDRMFWLEKKLNQANQAPSQQHKDSYSDEKTQIVEMLEHYERRLQEATDELREMIDLTHKNLIGNKVCRCKENEIKLKGSKEGENEHRLKDLQCELDEERRRSANFELQAKLTHKCLINQYHEDQKKIAELEQQLYTQSLASYTFSSHLNENLLECPGCQAKYPASDHRELINHIEICLN